jgi:anti-sigma regulatory factor (Ser/Thr protein kinase)
MGQAVWVREIHVTPDPRSVSVVRDFVADVLEQRNLRYLVQDAQLVVSELVTNALEHAGTTIDITLEEHPFCVVLTVHDCSPSLPVRAAAGVRSRGRGQDRGRGLMIVGGAALEWGVDPDPRGGKSVWVLFALAPPSFHEWVAGN